MNRPLVLLGFITLLMSPAHANALQTPEELKEEAREARKEGIIKARQRKARENQEEHYRASEAMMERQREQERVQKKQHRTKAQD